MDKVILQEFLDKSNVPKIKKRPLTFLGIAKQPHYENVLSNMYSFYFDVNGKHGLGDLFISTLQNLINKEIKNKRIHLGNEFSIETEYTTDEGGRIDLLFENEASAIIIENKVFHHLNNDLDDYWDSIKVDDSNKVGIVLSLNKMSNIKHEGFINITHLELLDAVFKNIGEYLLEADDKYLVFCKDLYQNIINMSTSIMTQEDLTFWFENQDKINEVFRYRNNVKNHIAEQVERTCSMNNLNLKLYKPRGNGKNRFRYYYSAIDADLMITVVFRDLLNSKRELSLIVELRNKRLKNKEIYKAIEFSQDDKKILQEGFYIDKNNTWAHFASRSYILDSNNIENLSSFISDKLESEHFFSVFKKIEDFLKIRKIENKKQV